MGTLDRKPGGFATALLVGLVLIAVAATGGILAWRRSKTEHIRRNEQRAGMAVRFLAPAQADFRANDRDGNKVNDFWTGDVAGLHYLYDSASLLLSTPGAPIRVVSQSIADADPAPAGTRSIPAVPFHGYYFRAMDFDEDGNALRRDTGGTGPNGSKNRNTARFAFCAYPAEYGRTGRLTFIISEGNEVFWADTGGKPVLRWPAGPRKAGWSSPD